MTATNATATAKTNAARVSYGFNLTFPAKFTMSKLIADQAYNAKRANRVAPQYITLYMRVKKALKDGVIVVAGKQKPKASRKGRQELIYVRANAKTTSVTAGSPVVA
jgi:hypothetical protein